MAGGVYLYCCDNEYEQSRWYSNSNAMGRVHFIGNKVALSMTSCN